MEKDNRHWLVLAGFAAFALGSLIPNLNQWVTDAGRNIHFAQGAEEYLYALSWAIGLSGVIMFLKIPWTIKKHLLWLWGLRCSITLIAMIYYEGYYGLDAYEYFKNIVHRNYYSGFEWGDGSNAVVQLGSILDEFFSIGRSYHAFKVIWSFFGFLAIIPLYNIYKLISKEDNFNVLWILGAFPSLLFWTSILGKDPLAILGIACLSYGTLRMQKFFDLASLFYLVTGTMIVSLIRVWLGPMFLAPALIIFILNPSSRLIWRMSGGAILAGVLTFLVLRMPEVFNMANQAEALESLNQMSSAWARGGSSNAVPSFSSPAAVIQFLPTGIFTALFRPLPGEVNNLFGIIAGLESTIILLMFLNSLRLINGNYFKNPIILYSILAILIWGSFYAFISYQNMGSGVRFRAQILPFLLLLPFMIKELVRQDNLKNLGLSPSDEDSPGL